MKIADFLRGVEGVAIADVNIVFNTVKADVQAVPFLPTNIKNDVVTLVSDAQTDFNGLVSLGGTLAGSAAGDAVDDLTTLLLNTSNAVSNSKSIADLSAAEKTILGQTWSAMKAQGDTLMAQFMAGIDPTKPAP